MQKSQSCRVIGSSVLLFVNADGAAGTHLGGAFPAGLRQKPRETTKVSLRLCLCPTKKSLADLRTVDPINVYDAFLSTHTLAAPFPPDFGFVQ